MSANTGYGFLIQMISTGTAGMRIDEVRDNTTPLGESYASGGLLRSDSTTHTFGQSGDDLVFYIQATMVPEPSGIAFLLLGAGCLFIRRRTS